MLLFVMRCFQIVKVDEMTGAIHATGVSIQAENLNHAKDLLKQEYPFEYENCGWKIFS
jgi:hypothetical protein